MYTHVLDNSSDKSDEGPPSYAGGDAESQQSARQQYDVCSCDCRNRIHHLQGADSHYESDDAPGVVAFLALVLYEPNVEYAARIQLGRKRHNLHNIK